MNLKTLKVKFMKDFLNEQVMVGIIKKWSATKDPKKYLIEFN